MIRGRARQIEDQSWLEFEMPDDLRYLKITKNIPDDTEITHPGTHTKQPIFFSELKELIDSAEEARANEPDGPYFLARELMPCIRNQRQEESTNLNNPGFVVAILKLMGRVKDLGNDRYRRIRNSEW